MREELAILLRYFVNIYFRPPDLHDIVLRIVESLSDDSTFSDDTLNAAPFTLDEDDVSA